MALLSPARDVAETQQQFREWLGQARADLPVPPAPGRGFAERLQAIRELQAVLFDAGWARIGWPEEVGGLGGHAGHRAALYDELGCAGYATRSAFEHVEILAPALVARWETRLVREMLPRLLRGDELWCQGFSEPDAGSDLVSLRTRAVRDGEDYVLNGRKIWTSWASVAARCVVLARTGTPEERHRGLSVFFVDLDAPGVEVRPLRQANGSEELAEVTFDEVRVRPERLVGSEGEGWPVALDVLSCERSAFAWLRQVRLYDRADRLAGLVTPSSAAALGEVLVDLFALRTTAAGAVRALAGGTFLGPAAAPAKVLLTDAEQHLYDLAQGAMGGGLALGDPGSADVAELQEEYLFSRAVSIYGGTRQIQLTTIARFLLGMKDGAR